MEPEHYVTIIVATLTITTPSVIGLVLSYKANRNAKEANAAVNQNRPGSTRLYDLALRSLEYSERNAEAIVKIGERLEQHDEEFRSIHEFLTTAQARDES